MESNSSQRGIFYTVEEYLAFENGAQSRHDYFQGEILAHAGTNSRHAVIRGNIAFSLHSQLRGRTGKVRTVDQRLHIEATNCILYPDIIVSGSPEHCSEMDSIALVDATAIVEVLSPATARYDQGAKFEIYSHLPSFRHYLLVEQSHIGVEHHFLRDGQWQSEVFNAPNQQIHLAALDCKLVLSEIYEEIEL